MTPEQTAAIASAVADIVKAYGEKHIEPLAAENAVLRGRLELLEAHVKSLPTPRDGADGKDGKDGRDGVDGGVGPMGPAGKDGAAGDQGVPGAKGDPGEIGRPGIDGKNGADGIAGKDGRDGINGKDGASVDPASVRMWVIDEVQKAIKSFPPPRDGRDGAEGQPGRDALEIIPERGMNEAVAYQRGTWVTHRGGLFVAYRATDPVKDGDYEAAGWQVANNGLADLRVDLAADQRTLLVSLERSDGRVDVRRIKTAMQVHRGVFRDGTTYERGDNVTQGGSTWHANETTADKPGEGSKAWTLITKRGRDGKDAGEKTT